MHRPSVFIGMPVYNGERFIKEAIDSLLTQSFADFTLFISDDGSTDRTSEIARAYAARDSRIAYLRQPHNLGMFGNFKFVLDHANGEYFMWAAQDDLHDTDYLKLCVEKLDSRKDVSLATTVVELIDTFGRTLAKENEVASLSGAPSLLQVSKYVLMKEGLGKANLMYGLWRLEAAKTVWDAYPQRNVWAQDYHVALALVTRYGVYVHPQPFFKKRLGGFSSQEFAQSEKLPIRFLSYKDRNNGIPLKNFNKYLKNHLEAARGTKFVPWVAFLLYLRLPETYFTYAKQRNYKKIFKRLLGSSSTI